MFTSIKEVANETPRAYVPFHPAVKSSQPRDVYFAENQLFSQEKAKFHAIF